MTEGTAAIVSRVSMLGICSAGGCTTIVFGQGTCVLHDQPRATVRRGRTDEDASPGGEGFEESRVTA